MFVCQFKEEDFARKCGTAQSIGLWQSNGFHVVPWERHQRMSIRHRVALDVFCSSLFNRWHSLGKGEGKFFELKGVFRNRNFFSGRPDWMDQSGASQGFDPAARYEMRSKYGFYGYLKDIESLVQVIWALKFMLWEAIQHESDKRPTVIRWHIPVRNFAQEHGLTNLREDTP